MYARTKFQSIWRTSDFTTKFVKDIIYKNFAKTNISSKYSCSGPPALIVEAADYDFPNCS